MESSRSLSQLLDQEGISLKLTWSPIFTKITSRKSSIKEKQLLYLKPQKLQKKLNPKRLKKLKFPPNPTQITLSNRHGLIDRLRVRHMNKLRRSAMPSGTLLTLTFRQSSMLQIFTPYLAVMFVWTAFWRRQFRKHLGSCQIKTVSSMQMVKMLLVFLTLISRRKHFPYVWHHLSCQFTTQVCSKRSLRPAQTLSTLTRMSVLSLSRNRLGLRHWVCAILLSCLWPMISGR